MSLEGKEPCATYLCRLAPPLPKPLPLPDMSAVDADKNNRSNAIGLDRIGST